MLLQGVTTLREEKELDLGQLRVRPGPPLSLQAEFLPFWRQSSLEGDARCLREGELVEVNPPGTLANTIQY